MKKRITTIIILSAILMCMLPMSTWAASIPTTWKAPASLSATATEDSEYQTSIFFSVDSELLKFIDYERTDHSSLGINSIGHTAQIDWKLNNGSWHYTKDWDDLSESYAYDSAIYTDTGYLYGDTTDEVLLFDLREQSIRQILGNAVVKSATDEENRLDLANNTFYFRVRFLVSYYDEGAEESKFILSPWSETLAYGKEGASIVKPAKLEKPTISNPFIDKNHDGSPKFTFTSITPTQVQDAQNYIKANDKKDLAVEHQININNSGWVEAQAGGWSLSCETRSIDVPLTYNNGETVKVDEAFIQLRMRYTYEGGGNVGKLASEWSNIISVNTPAWSNASSWATAELQKAADTGLIPDILKGADMTKPITREEFCELSVLLFEKVTKGEAQAASSNPFTDTTNPRILKAYNLKITEGTSTTTFSPGVLINREQCSAMLFRAIKAIQPNGDFSTAGIKDFPDQKNISKWAVDATKYMSKNGIIKGDSKGNFMPKATTTVQQAAGYGMATREAAILMTMRAFDKIQ